ncbi:MAG TPA: MFS transporter [Candidatus Cybelea sp.]|jgi:cyanate permease|nr:MFS transporter [Candidatus Cybelea sp.]
MERQSGFYGWKLLAVFWIILFANFAFPLYGASVVNTDMAASLHWDRSQLGLAYAIFQWMVGVPAPLVALLITKTGVRFTAALGCVVVVTGALLMSLVVRTSLQVDLVFGVMIGLGAMTGGVLVAQTGINRWFSKRKGLAITLVHTGGTLGGFASVRVLDKVIRVFNGNWRAGWWLMAALSALSAILAVLFVRERPADFGQFPDGASADASDSGSAPSHLVSPALRSGVHKTTEDWSFGEALHTPAFWLYLVSILGFSSGYPLYLAHGVAHLRDLGFTPAAAASSISIMLLCALVGTLFFAAVADHIEPRLVWAGASLIFGIGVLLALRASGAAGLYLYAICMGTSFGASFSAMMVLPANYFGAKAYASLISLVMVVGTTAAAAGAYVAGVIFDRVGSYAPALSCVAGMSFVAAILLLFAVPPVRKHGPVIARAPAAAI